MMRAGKVKIDPAATASPADAMACTRLFSRMVAPPAIRRNAIEMTAAGILADTVRPAYRPRYALAAPRISARTIPSAMPRGVSSRGVGSGDGEAACTAQLYAIDVARGRRCTPYGGQAEPNPGFLPEAVREPRGFLRSQTQPTPAPTGSRWRRRTLR